MGKELLTRAWLAQRYLDHQKPNPAWVTQAEPHLRTVAPGMIWRS